VDRVGRAFRPDSVRPARASGQRATGRHSLTRDPLGARPAANRRLAAGFRRHTAPHGSFPRGARRFGTADPAGPLQVAPRDHLPKRWPDRRTRPALGPGEKASGPGPPRFETSRSVPRRPERESTAGRRTHRPPAEILWPAIREAPYQPDAPARVAVNPCSNSWKTLAGASGWSGLFPRRRWFRVRCCSPVASARDRARSSRPARASQGAPRRP
jgi:hypothetical protein